MNMLFCLVILIIGTSLDEPLSPSVEKDLAFQAPRVAPEDNAYVGIAGLSFIQDGDPVTAGLKYLAKGYQNDPEPRRTFDSSYRNPCLGLSGQDQDLNCLDQIVADAPAITEDALKNQEVLARYQTVAKMPLFVNTSSKFDDPVPRYQVLIDASRLIGVKALLDIKQNRPAAGLEAIEADLAFHQMICESEQVSLIDLMISVAVIKTHLIGLNKVLEDGGIDLGGQEDRLRKILSLDLKANRMMEAALSKEKREFILLFDDLSGEWFGADPSLEYQLKEKLHWFLFKKNMTLNRIAARADKNIEFFKAAPLVNFPDYYARYLDDMDKEELSYDERLEFKNLYKEYGLLFFKNYSGEMMIGIAQPMYGLYAARINDALVYARLIRAQLELRLMGARPENVPEALTRLGPETWNPYTGRPFSWDEEKRILRAEAADEAVRPRDPDHSGRKMEARLPTP